MKSIRSYVVVLAVLLSYSASAKPAFKKAIDRVPDRYIVVFDDEHLKTMPELPEHAVRVLSDQLTARYGGKVLVRWHQSIRGFLAEMNEGQALGLLNDPRIKVVEEDAVMYLSDSTGYSHVDRMDDSNADADGNGAYGDGTYDYTSCTNGEGVRVYVLDTGVRQTHAQFRNPDGSSRVVQIPATPTFPKGGNVAEQHELLDYGYLCGRNCDISPSTAYANAGHGTGVAAMIGGNTVGMARRATIYPVRISTSDAYTTVAVAITGVEVVKDHYLNNNPDNDPAVANFSMWYKFRHAFYVNDTNVGPDYPAGVNQTWWNSDPTYDLVDTAQRNAVGGFEYAVDDLVATGVTVFASANNQRIDARWTSPARIPSVITVGGTMPISESGAIRESIWVANTNPADRTNTDPGSNMGPAVDLWAPAQVTTAFHTDDTVLVARAGTSFSSPIVAGLAARYLTNGNRSISWPLLVANYFRDRANEARYYYGDAVRVRGDLQGAVNDIAWHDNACRTQNPWY